MKIMTIAGVALLLVAAAVPVVSRVFDAEAATVDVSADDNFFSPSSLTVNVGDTVRWTNDGAIIHTVDDDGAAFSSGIMQPDDVFTHTYSNAGTFPYTCIVHSGMTGTIIVQEPATSTATTGAGTATPTRTRTATATASATPSPTGTVTGTVTPLPTLTPPPPAAPSATATRTGGAGPSITAPNTGHGGGVTGGDADGIATGLAALGAALVAAGAIARRRAS